MCLLIYQQMSENQNTVHLKTGLAGNDFSKRGLKRRLTAKEISIANCEVFKDEKYRIAVQGILVGIIIKTSSPSRKVTDLLVCLRFFF